MGKISAKDQKTLSGVGFDQHYTDSALKLLAPGSYARHEKLVRTRRSVPRQEILVSLLLFGKAYLSRPTWLYGLGFPELERFENEKLVEWMPNDVYDTSYTYLDILILRLERKAWLTFDRSAGFDDLYDKSARRRKLLLERELIESDVSHDISVMIEKIFYVSPMVGSNLKHLGFRSKDPEASLLWPALNGAPDWIGFASHANQEKESFLGQLAEREAYEALNDDEEDDQENDNEDEKYRVRSEFATVLDAAASSLAAERFSARTALPFKTSGDVSSSQHDGTIVGPEAYQLLKIQFQDLRYPVVQSIEDVLRLREDPHLRTYRSVIAEYSERLREELESERPQVIKEFRKDMRLALNSLIAVKRWSKIIDLSFYVSIPLVVIGMFSGLPISDILAIPLTTYAKIVSYQKRKELDWILFGRSGE